MSDKTLGILSWGIFMLLVTLAVWAAVAQERRWQEFKIAHACYVVERTPASTSYGTAYVNGKSGTVATYVPSKTAWLCDDGVKYWR